MNAVLAQKRVARIRAGLIRAAWLGAAAALLTVALLIILAWSAAPAAAQAATSPAQPNNTMGLGNFLQAAQNAVGPQQLSTTMTLFLLLTVLTLAPAIVLMTTSFTRIIVVLGFLRQAMATQQTPPNQVLIGLALFLTGFIMMPTYVRVYDEAVQPYVNRQIDYGEALNRGIQPVREFMFRQVLEHPKDLALFINIAKLPRPNTPDDVPTHVLICAFVLNEMRIAFMIGFVIYIPFLIIDMVVASTLMAMGMMMLPPVFISLPFKIVLFVLADGWYLVVQGLVNSFT